MTPLDLDAIEARASYESWDSGDRWWLAERVPALIAEVRRLRECQADFNRLLGISEAAWRAESARADKAAPPWLADAAEALGEVRPEDGAPKAMNWTQVLTAIRDMRDERAEWKSRAESAEAKVAAAAAIVAKANEYYAQALGDCSEYAWGAIDRIDAALSRDSTRGTK